MAAYQDPPPEIPLPASIAAQAAYPGRLQPELFPGVKPLVSYPRFRSDGAPQTAHDIWEIWTAGAFHAGDSFSLSLLADKGLLGSPYSQHGIL